MLKLRANSVPGWKSCLAAALVLLISTPAATVLSAMPRGERHETRHEIDQLEENWRDAVVSRNIPAVNALLSDDYMGITAGGMLQSKDQTIAALRSGAVRFASIALSDRKVRFYGETALVTSRAEVTGTTPDGNITGNYRYTHVWVRNDKGIWQIVSFEASRIREHGDHK